MRYLVAYDMVETARVAGQWMGATAQAAGSFPWLSMLPNPAIAATAAWGEVTERSLARMVAKPDWGIDSVVTAGREYPVSVARLVERPFGDLIHFRATGRGPMPRRVLLVAPMSGHYATLLRKTVISLLPNCDVFVTDWHNARDIPVSCGRFDVEDYTLYLADFIQELGPETNVIAVC